MSAKRQAEAEQEVVEPLVIERGRIVFGVLGETPLVFNRQTEKVKQGLLLPRGGLSKVDKESRLKHDVYQEFFDSPYKIDDPMAPTLLCAKAAWFKAAIANAALDMPGMAKAQIGRLVQVPGEMIPLYGIPELFMTTIKQAGITGAPDVRTRAIVPKWACVVEVTYIKPLITEKAVSHLAAGSGMLCGVGDGRPQKGRLEYGQYTLVRQDNSAFRAIIKAGGRHAQEMAMKSPKAYDHESADLRAWFEAEVERRGRTKQLHGKESS